MKEYFQLRRWGKGIVKSSEYKENMKKVRDTISEEQWSLLDDSDEEGEIIL